MKLQHALHQEYGIIPSYYYSIWYILSFKMKNQIKIDFRKEQWF